MDSVRDTMSPEAQNALRVLDEKLSALRAAWNNHVFARIGMAPGAGMAIVPEDEAHDKLSDAFHDFTDSWDGLL